MKKTSDWPYPLALILWITAVVTAFLCGCATTEQGAYRTIGITVTLVDNGMNVWGDYVRAGKATAAEEAKVRSLYENYQSAMRVAKGTVLTLKNSKADDALWLKVAASLDATRADLLAFIDRLIPTAKLKMR